MGPFDPPQTWILCEACCRPSTGRLPSPWTTEPFGEVLRPLGQRDSLPSRGRVLVPRDQGSQRAAGACLAVLHGMDDALGHLSLHAHQPRRQRWALRRHHPRLAELPRGMDAAGDVGRAYPAAHHPPERQTRARLKPAGTRGRPRVRVLGCRVCRGVPRRPAKVYVPVRPHKQRQVPHQGVVALQPPPQLLWGDFHVVRPRVGDERWGGSGGEPGRYPVVCLALPSLHFPASPEGERCAHG
mmetsp:Transcript_42930/g.86794  ORF Transcript_42930/g.86794 Transcript_42930/m.86794 type:complete len:241 (-) Transcript_42930:271-993(-)